MICFVLIGKKTRNYCCSRTKEKTNKKRIFRL